MIIRRNLVGGGHGGGNTGLVYFDDVGRVAGVVGIKARVTGVEGDVERVTGVVGIIAGPRRSKVTSSGSRGSWG